MKIAIVCDWLVSLGGAEKVLHEMLLCFPTADLFAVVDFIPADKRDIILNKTVKTTFIQQLPFAKTKYRNYLPLMPIAIEQLDVSGYDLVISSSHAVAKGVITGPGQVHISYVHTPMRYAWDLQHQYLQETGLQKKPQGLLVRWLLHKLRLWDVRSANGVDHFIANSHYIARRIHKTYRREAKVIYPPVDTSLFVPQDKKDNFYLTASRFVPYKRIDLIVDSFRNLPDKELVVIGEGPDFAKIQAKANKNVTLLGNVSKEVLVSYMQRAKAFVFAAEEDFGIVPVEAQACGTPVIAFGKGGALETVRDLQVAEPTGVFFAEQSVEAICAAIKTFEANQDKITVTACVNNAKRFAVDHFKKQLIEFVNASVRAK